MVNRASTAAMILTLKTPFAKHGFCREIVSGNGTKLTSEEFKIICNSKELFVRGPLRDLRGLMDKQNVKWRN